jgi:hypothetical protein
VYDTKYKTECKETYTEECHEEGYSYHKEYKCKKKPHKDCHDVPIQVRKETKTRGRKKCCLYR